MSNLRRVPPLLYPAASRHTATVIFLHGLGDTGEGWRFMVENWRRRSRLDEVKFILPHAPKIPITCNFGMTMPGWYDIMKLTGRKSDLKENQDEAGLNVSRAYLNELIQKEIDDGIPPERIVLGGFSQGAAVSLYTGLTAKVKLGGLAVLSSYLPLDYKMPDLLKETNLNQKTRILMCHGSEDRVVPTEFGKDSYARLKELGFDVTFTLYPGIEHQPCLEEMDEVEKFLGSCLPPAPEKRSEL